MRLRRLIAVALLFAAGCTDADAPGVSVASPFSTDFQASVSWGACPYSAGIFDDSGVSCAQVAVPLRWEQPSGPTIDLLVRRIESPGESEGAVWLLQGGPGFDGDDLVPVAEQLHGLGLRMDVYVLDHRGTGDSAHLDCPTVRGKGLGDVPHSAMDACLEEAAKPYDGSLMGFTTEAAAADLGVLIQAIHGDGERPHVVGISYGTYWLHRYAAMFPGQAASLVFDSLCIGPSCDFARWDHHHDRLAKELLERCAEDKNCSERLGPSPTNRVAQVLDSLDKGHCNHAVAMGLDRDGARAVMGLFMMFRELMALVPVVAWRLSRCSSADLKALEGVADLLKARPPEDAEPAGEEGYSMVLYNHIKFSELFHAGDQPPSAWRAGLDKLLVSTDATMSMHALSQGWPRYPADARAQQTAVTSSPVLALQGGLDGRTPLAEAQVGMLQLQAPGPGLVVLPDVGHSVMTTAHTKLGRLCVMENVVAWLNSPGAPTWDACAQDLAPLDITAEATDAGMVLDMGVDPWKSAGRAVSPSRRRSRKEALRSLWRRARMPRRW